MVTRVGCPLGMAAGAKLESFLASSASFFVFRHTLVYALPKTCRFFTSFHYVNPHR